VKSWRFAKGCPSVEYNKFQPYSAGGRLTAALSLLEGRSSYTDRFIDIVYNCLLCGNCDVACKVCRYNMEPLQAMHELRFKLVEDGQLLPQQMSVIEGLRKEDNMMMKPKAERGNWAEGLNIKNLTQEKAEVVFHAGCRLSYDEERRVPGHASRQKPLILASWQGYCRGVGLSHRYQGNHQDAENNMEAWTNASEDRITSCSVLPTFAPLRSGLQVEVVHGEFVDGLLNKGR
jgi:hypothetical protein